MILLPLLFLSGRAPYSAASQGWGDLWRSPISGHLRAGAQPFWGDGEEWKATSPEAGLRGTFTLAGAQLVSHDGRLDVQTVRWGRPGALRAATATRLGLGACASGEEDALGRCARRLEIQSAGFTEAWESTPDGFEQRWIVDRSPPGSGDLVIEVAINGAAVVAGEGEARLHDRDGETWHVGGLRAWDADGVTLPVRLEQSADGFRLRLDDTRAHFPIEVDPVYGKATATFTGEAEGDELYHVSGVGDINGDGYDDIAVAAAGYNSDTGRVYIYLGSASGAYSTPDATLDGEELGDLFGQAVSGAGDVDGDGYEDVIVGAHGYDADTGRSYIYLGSASGLSDVPSTTLDGTSSGDDFGLAVSGAGDLDGDGYDDVVVGAPNANVNWGSVSVYYGSASGISTSDVSTLSGEADDREMFGSSVSGAGDVNGDGYDDVVIGALGLGGGYDYDYGRAYVFHGSASGVSTSAASMLVGAYIWDGFGNSVSNAGDVDGDGYGDIVVGCFNYVAGGRAYVYSGSPTGISTRRTVLSGEDSGDYFGVSVSGLGDVNGDGYDDVIVGAYGYGDLQGRAYVYQGTDSGISTAAATTLTGETADDLFGNGVSGAGDVNGDGYDDFLVGAWGYSTYTGRAYLYLSNIDADGDGSFSVDDCDDADASIYPGAVEVACDTIDQNCDGTDSSDGCDTGADSGDTGADSGDTGADSGDTGTDTGDTSTDTSDTSTDTSDTSTDSGDTGDSSPPDTDATDTGDTSDTAPGDSGPAHSGGADDTAPKTPPDCGCATPPQTSSVGSTSLLLSLLSLLTLRRRSACAAGRSGRR